MLHSGQTRLRNVLALVLMLGHCASSQYVTSEDLTIASQASTAQNVYCSGNGFVGSIDRAAARESLTKASGNNIVRSLLISASSTSAVQSEAQSKLLNANFILQAGSPIAGAIVMYLAWLFCCWTACPCKLCCGRCHCCRCCVANRKTHVLIKLFCIIVLIGLILGMIICAALSYRSYTLISNSVSNVGCVSAKMVNSTFNGQVNPSFIGMIPMLNIFQNISTVLNANSAFMVDMQNTLDSTQGITKAITVSSGTLRLLQNTMDLSANEQPKGLTGNSLKHTCLYCQQVSTILSPVISALDTGVGSALSEARTSVMNQLTGSAATTLQTSISAAAAPLVQMKDQVRTSFGFFVTSTSWVDFKDKLVSGQTPLLLVACGLIIVLAIALALCATGSCMCFTTCEKYSKDGSQRTRRTPSRCACITWCCGFWYVIFTLLIGGLVVLISVPTSGICLIADNMSGSELKQIAGGLGINATLLSQTGQIVDQCFRNPNASANVLLLQLVNASATETMYDKLVKQVQGSIDDAFKQIYARNMSDTLTGNSNVQSLITFLQTVSVDSLIQPDTSLYATDTDYMNILSNNVLKPKFVSSARCTDLPYEGATVYGVESFRQALATLGTAQPGANCISNAAVVCTPGNTLAACNSGNNFITLKQSLMTSNIFRCDLFMDSNGNTCDPLFMTGSPSTGYTNDCLLSSGGMMKTKEISCTLPEFVTYVSQYGQRVSNVLSRVDDETVFQSDKVKNGLYILVNRYILSPIMQMANGVTCGWMGQIYSLMLDGLCFQGVYGLYSLANSYIACACFAVPIIPIMYLQWRRGVDNINTPKAEDEPVNA